MALALACTDRNDELRMSARQTIVTISLETYTGSTPTIFERHWSDPHLAPIRPKRSRALKEVLRELIVSDPPADRGPRRGIRSTDHNRNDDAQADADQRCQAPLRSRSIATHRHARRPRQRMAVP